MSKKMPALGVLGPSPTDERDYKYQNRLLAKSINVDLELPEKFLLTGRFLEPRNQGSYGSCAAQTAACVVEGLNYEQYAIRRYMSPAFVYSLRSGQSGMYMRNVCKILHKYGIPFESTYSYDPENFEGDGWKKPWSSGNLQDVDVKHAEEASRYKVGEYRTVKQTEHEIKAAIFSEKAPLLIAVPVYMGPNDATYKNRMWKFEKGDSNVGGHAMAMIGWDDNIVAYKGCLPGAFLIRNSWGDGWGEEGYTWFPYSDLKTKREADIENASEWPNEGYAQPMPWEIWAVIDSSDIVPDPEPEPEPLPLSNVPVWVWILIAAIVGIPLIVLIASLV